MKKVVRVQPPGGQQAAPYWEGGFEIPVAADLMRLVLPTWSCIVPDGGVLSFRPPAPQPAKTYTSGELLRHLLMNEPKLYDRMLDVYRVTQDKTEQRANAAKQPALAPYDLHFTDKVFGMLSREDRSLKRVKNEHNTDSFAFDSLRFRHGSDLLLYVRQNKRTIYDHLVLNMIPEATPMTPFYFENSLGRHVEHTTNVDFANLGLDFGSPKSILSFGSLSTFEQTVYNSFAASMRPTFKIGAENFGRREIKAMTSAVFLPDVVMNAFIAILRRNLADSRKADQKPMIVFNSLFMPKLMGQDKGVYSYDNLYTPNFFGSPYLATVLTNNNIFEAAAVYIPLNVPHFHWSGALVLFEKKTILYLDSLQKRPCYRVYAVLQFLGDHYRKLKQDGVLPADAEDFNPMSWKIEVAVIASGENQVNVDAINCLVYQCAYIEQLCEESRP